MSVDFERRLTEYLDTVSAVTSEASKTFLFLNFISEVFKDVEADYAEKLLPELEKYIRVKHGTARARIIHVSPSEAPIGSKINITGEGFTPKTGILLSLEGLLFLNPITTDENGEFNVTMFVPMVNSGNYTIKATVTYPYPASIANTSFTVTFGVDTLLSNQVDIQKAIDNIISNATATQQTLHQVQSTTQETLDEATATKDKIGLIFDEAKEARGFAKAAKAIANEARTYALIAMIFAIATTVISVMNLVKRK